MSEVSLEEQIRQAKQYAYGHPGEPECACTRCETQRAIVASLESLRDQRLTQEERTALENGATAIEWMDANFAGYRIDEAEILRRLAKGNV